MSIDIIIRAPIAPHGKGRPRTAVIGGHARIYTPKETVRWESDFASIAAPHCPDVILDEPLRVDILAVLPRPKSLMRRRDPDGFVWCVTKPDADNIRKAVLDSLSAFWRTDALVVAGETFKVHAEKDGTPRTVVRIQSAPLTLFRPIFGTGDSI